MIDFHPVSPYVPFCRQCVNRRNGRLALAGGAERGLGPVHYQLDGGRAVLMVRHRHAPCRECGQATNRFYRAVALSDLLAVEASGQMSFVTSRRLPRRRRKAPESMGITAQQLTFIGE